MATSASAAASGMEEMSAPGVVKKAARSWLKYAPLGIVTTLAITLGVAAYGFQAPKTIQGKPTPPGSWLNSGSWGIPLFGETLDFMRSQFLWTLNKQEKHGNISQAYVLGHQAAILSGPEAMKIFYNDALISRFDPFNWHFKAQTRGNILNMLEGERFKARKDIILKAIKNKDALESIIPSIQKTIHKYLRKWSSPKEQRFVHPCQLLACEIGLDILVGEKGDLETKAQEVRSLIADVLNGVVALPINLPFTTFARGIESAKKLTSLYNSSLEEHLQSTDTIASTSAMARMAKELQRQPNEDRNGLVTEIHHMMMAETALVGNALSWVLMSFSLHPEAWEKVKEEVRAEVKDGEPLTQEVLDGLDYLGAVADEVRRLYPGVAGMMGEVIQPFEFQGFIVPKGWTAIGAFYATCHDASAWRQPFEFRPDRYYEGEPVHGGKQWAWVPQGTSRHQCAGIDLTTNILKIFMVELVRNECQWDTPHKQRWDFDMSLFNPEPVDGVRLGNFRCK